MADAPSSANKLNNPAPPDVFGISCPSRGLLERLGERWTMLVLIRLKDRPVRFGQLRRDIQGITQKMLTQTLRRLERDGLVLRHTVREKPIAVEYQLTEMVKNLIPTLLILKQWVEANHSAVLVSNAAYDARS
ncbi:helix-turn-helix domain-containing protein [Acidipila sp. EB88]|uniref:winged helix-turn-helix transcriptional regulator n=1 Tax=Acidipila sp. EB88 TaxID=2305226 RepID=UPI000F5FF78A|nr:helix-turn-helix domain-containing protein [Acidipila sp. EB88]RRA49293.1 transcriptional regulator [Acidipila sp. EB88]